jgi:hypothetical protein
MSKLAQEIERVLREFIPIRDSQYINKDLIAEILNVVREVVPAGQIKEDYHPLDPENQYFEGYNQCRSEIFKRLEE